MGLFEEFKACLERKDKESCIRAVVSSLSSGEIDVVRLYTEVLAPVLNEDYCKDGDEGGAYCIWEEHVRTSIVRTVIENCYPFVARERKERYGSASGQRVLVVCPTEELHEIGARMVADFFDLCGYDVTFIGANTPQEEIIEAISYVRPAYVAISVSNYYNLVAAKRAVRRIRELRSKEGLDFKVIVGGRAFLENPDVAKDIGADIQLRTFDDIHRLSEQDGG